MTKLIPFGSLITLVIGGIGVFAVLTVAGVFDDDDPQARGEGVSAVCAEGFEDCIDTIVVNDGDGDDDASGLPPVFRDDLTQTCAIGTADCSDPPLEAGDDVGPLPPVDGVLPEPDRTDDESLAIEAAFAALEAMDGPPSNEVEVSGVRATDWSDACLGVETPGIACAQVITPGFIVFLSGGGGDYEFHTDTNGNAIFAPY